MFKEGDWVECVNAICVTKISEGGVYRVSGAKQNKYGQFVKLDLPGIDYWFDVRRFKLAKKAPSLIGLCGRATAGKDAVADVLVREFGFVKIGWADPLYRLALWINPRISMFRRLSDYVDRYGWTEAKRIPAIRSFLQKLGTEGGRECLHPDVWIMVSAPTILDHIKAGTPVVITNCRFSNEAQWVKDNGGVIVKVTRPGIDRCNDHKSEDGEADAFAQYEIHNGQGLLELGSAVKEFMGELR